VVTWSFGEFEVNEARFRLLKSGHPMPLEPRAFDVLVYLIRHRERVVARAELLRALWPGVVVRGTVVGRLISGLRAALRDDAHCPRYIETLRGRGFRFVHPVEVAAAVAPGTPSGIGSASDAPLAIELPSLPRIFVGRQRELRELLSRLCGEALCDVRAQSLIAVHGWPGVGKSTLVARLLSDAALTSRFDGGTLWCRLGPEPDLRGQLAAWCAATGLEGVRTKSLGVAELSGLLNRQLRGRRVLIAIDDLWDARHVAPLRLGGVGSALLVTTRMRGVADAIASEDEVVRLDVLGPRDALELLTHLAPGIVESHPQECGELMRQLEGLPLAIHVAANLLKAELRRGFRVVDLLRRLLADCAPILAAEVPVDVGGSIDTVDALIGRSSAQLTARTRDRFAALGSLDWTSAAFDDRAFTLAWGAEDVNGTLVELVERGLLEHVRSRRYQMHALVQAHAGELGRHMARAG
jgi:DNA-binding winged helix-turn-helix (wHTH) protein